MVRFGMMCAEPVNGTCGRETRILRTSWITRMVAVSSRSRILYPSSMQELQWRREQLCRLYFYQLDNLRSIRGERKVLRQLQASAIPVTRNDLVRLVFGRISSASRAQFTTLMTEVKRRLREGFQTPALRDSAYRLQVVHSTIEDAYRLDVVRRRIGASQPEQESKDKGNSDHAKTIRRKTPNIESISSSKNQPSVLLCHSIGDKAKIRRLRRRLAQQNFRTWLDEANLLPGQDWDAEIKRAVRACDVVLVCLSQSPVTKAGYVQKEIRFALDVADEKPDGTIYIIPTRLEECVIPSRLAQWQYVDLFKRDGFEKLCQAMRSRQQRS